MPGPWSRTQKRASPSATREPIDRLGLASVPDGILGELHDRLCDPLPVGDDLARAEARGPDPRRERRHLGVDLVRQHRHVDGPELEEVGLVVLREEQRSSTIRVIRSSSSATRASDASRSGVVFEQLEVPADDREWRPELVARVVDETSLCAERPLEPVEHLVEGHGELRDLIATVRRDSGAEVGLGDRPRRLRELGDGPDDTVGEPPGEKRAEEQEGDPDSADGTHGSVRVGLRPLGEDRGHEDAECASSVEKRNREVLHSAGGRLDLAPVARGERGPPGDEGGISVEVGTAPLADSEGTAGRRGT